MPMVISGNTGYVNYQPKGDRVKVFFDTKFTGLHQHTTLVSIGCVAENGRTFYAETNDYDYCQTDEWFDKNVLPNLYLNKHDGRAWTFPGYDVVEVYGCKRKIAAALQTWLESFGEPVEMWSDCLAYDWVLFCELYGGALKIPECVYYIPFDVCTLLKVRGADPDMNREQFAGIGTGEKHNALHDAKCIKALYEWFTSEPRQAEAD
jgi:hypothetical protein